MLIGLVVLLVACGSREALVGFRHQSECGSIAVSLTNPATGAVLELEVPEGELAVQKVEPSVMYDYEVDFTAGGYNQAGERCLAVRRGQVMVPAGQTQTFNLASATPTPSALTPGVTGTPRG